jgi:cold shock CspA family protein
MDLKRAQVKFVSDKGFGFMDGATGRVFFHASGYRRPQINYHQKPTVELVSDEARRPREGDWLVYLEETNDKGLSATIWCYRAGWEAACKKAETAPLYRLVYRYAKKTEPVCDTESRGWKEFVTVLERAYEATYDVMVLESLLEYKGEEMLRHGQFQLQRFDTGWVKCENVLAKEYGRFTADQSLWKYALEVALPRKVA